MSLSQKQSKILTFPFQDYEYLICDGAVRSGKTSLMTVAFIDDAMRRFNGRRFGICGKTVDSATKNIIDPYLSLYYAQHSYELKWRRSEKILEVKKGNVKNIFEVFGGKDESSYALIQGRTLAGALIDEVVLQPRSFVDQAITRCSVTGSKIWFSCNPAGYQHWFNQEWVLKAKEKNALHLHFTLDDNPGLSEQVKNRYKAAFAGVFYQRYILGEWVNAEGLVYDMFDRDRHVVDTLPKLSLLDTYVACDFGTQNATVFLLCQKAAYDDTWYVTREYYYSGRDQKRQKTVGEYVADLQQWLGGIEPQRVIADPSALPLIEEMHRRDVRVMKANNDVLDGILDVQTMLHNDKLKIYKDCKHTIDEFQVYAWDPDKEDTVIKESDHAMDAVRYLVRTKRLVKRISDNG